MRRVDLLPRLDAVVADDTTSLNNATVSAQKGDKTAGAEVNRYTERVQAIQAARNVLSTAPQASEGRTSKDNHPANNPNAAKQLVEAKTRQAKTSSVLQGDASKAIGVLLMTGQYAAAQAVGLLIEKQFGADPLAFYTDKTVADVSTTTAKS